LFGERVMASVSRFLTNKLRLKVNEAKSAVARPEERKFLGFSISNEGSERRIAPKALDKFKMQVRNMTRRIRGISLQKLIEELRPYLIGWRGCFSFCQTPIVLTKLEAWIRRRLRSYLWRQWQNGQNRFKELRDRGVSKFQAPVARLAPVSLIQRRITMAKGQQRGNRETRGDRAGLVRARTPEIDGGEGRSRQEEIARRIFQTSRETGRLGRVYVDRRYRDLARSIAPAESVSQSYAGRADA
jgi:RNA-directed DNA polymerase